MQRNVNSERLLTDLKELSQIGATKDGGVSRVAFSDTDILGRNWFREKIEEAGFEYRMDGAGNQSAIFHGAEPGEKKVLCGSHLDSVPNGGRYDGSLGTLAAFEALRTLKESGYVPPVSLEVVNFTSEENVVLLMMGSRAVTGKLKADDLARANLPESEFNVQLEKIGISRESILSARREDILAWIELHIEQATILEESKTDIGVVTGIVGIRNLKLRFEGKAAHAGTKPMQERQDALWGASAFILRARDLILNKYSPGVMNAGNLTIAPGALNIVPDNAILDIEFRHGTDEKLDEMQVDLLGLLTTVGQEFNLRTSHSSVPSVEPAPMDEQIISALEYASAKAGLSYSRLLSFAGHDTQNLASICPSAMFFVPSVDGISHAPDELTKDQDCINGANVILNALPKIAAQFS